LGEWHSREVDAQGDAFFAAIPKTTEVVAAMAEIQRILANEELAGSCWDLAA
jgi:hypothetical protein